MADGSSMRDGLGGRAREDFATQSEALRSHLEGMVEQRRKRVLTG